VGIGDQTLGSTVGVKIQCRRPWIQEQATVVCRTRSIRSALFQMKQTKVDQKEDDPNWSQVKQSNEPMT